MNSIDDLIGNYQDMKQNEYDNMTEKEKKQREKDLEVSGFLEDNPTIMEFINKQKNELETLSSAYNDLKREHSIVKQSLETHRDWLKSSDEEVVRLNKENKALRKRNAELKRKMNDKKEMK